MVNERLAAPPECISDPSTWCAQVWNITHNAWLAGSADWLLVKPARIILTLLIAFVLRHLLRKLINRLTTLPEDTNKVPALLKPLKERVPEALGPQVMERRRQRAKTIGSVMKSLTSLIVLGIAFVLCLGELGVDLAPIIASAGVLGVALGFGAQNLVRDFLSGMFMMIEDQYGVGDWADLGEASGTVEAVGLRVTTLRDVNGTVWYVRNGEVVRVGNYSQDFAIAVVDIPLAYKSDVARATSLLSDVAVTVVADSEIAPYVLEAPEVLGVQNVSVEGITLRLTIKTRPGSQWAVQRAVRARIMPALEEAGFEPPLGRFFGTSEATS